jgi:fatty-acyl-CoA synthase
MLSYVRGPSAPLSNLTIPQVLAATVARFPGRPALVSRHQNVRLTWSELAREVATVARGLTGLGLQPGDRMGVWTPNCHEWLLLQLAAAQAQLVLVNINPAYRSHEMRYVIGKSRMRALFLWESDERGDYRRILAEARDGHPDSLVHTVFLGHASWRRMLASPGPLPTRTADPHDVANIQYTSGTTGDPKGVLLTHHNLVNNGTVIAGGFHASEHDRICVPVPLYHCFGCVIGAMTWILSGAAMILPSERFDALSVLQAIEAEQATMVYGVPAMFIAELNHPEFPRFRLNSLRTGMMAGSPCPIEIMKRVMNDMHCAGVVIGYGQTESSPIITMSKVDDPVSTRVTTVGTVMPNTEVKIVSTEDGSTVPFGEEGELCARGYMVMKGYDGDPETTAATVDAEGWLHTGDLARMQPDGYIKITGRAKDTIIRGGENISPREVEEFLHTHPKIADVQVVGVPDLQLGEAIAAWVSLTAGAESTEEEIRDFCRGKIAHFKIPKYVRFVDGFPMTVSGKVQKFRMRHHEIQQRGLQAADRIEMA